MKASTINEKKSSDVGQKGKLCRCNESLQMYWDYADVIGLCKCYRSMQMLWIFADAMGPCRLNESLLM